MSSFPSFGSRVVSRLFRAVACAGPSVLTACGAGPTAGALELREAVALDVPLGEALAGVAGTDAGAVAAWSRGRLFWSAGPGQRLREVTGGPRQLAGAAFIAGDSLLEAVGAGGEVVRLDLRGGGAVARTRFAPPVPVQVAVHTADGWVGGGVDPAGRFLVFPLRADRPDVRLAVEPDTAAGPSAVALQLAAAGADVLATELEPPFRTRRVRPDGLLAREFQPRRPPPEAPADTLRGEVRWVSLPVVPLARGYLQMLADLGSDRRLIVLYDESGREVRRRAVDVPLGITGITPRKRYLLASRNAGKAEVLLYSWRWNNSRQGEAR